jgi:hypothetical protein
MMIRTRGLGTEDMKNPMGVVYLIFSKILILYTVSKAMTADRTAGLIYGSV